MPQIPETWQFEVNAPISTQAQIIIPPPSPGVQLILTHIFAKAMDVSGIGVHPQDVQVLDGITQIFSQHLVTDSEPGAVLSTDSFDTDVVKQSSPGTGMTVQFTAAVPGTVQNIVIQGSIL